MRGPAAVVAVFVALAALPAGAQDKQIRRYILDLRSRDDDVRYQAAARLRVMGHTAKAAIPALVKALDDSRGYVRDEVRLALRNLSGANPNALLRGLKSKNVKIRRGVAQVLDGKWKPWHNAVPSPPRLPQRHIGALVAALNDEDAQVRTHMASALVSYGERAIPALVRAMASPKSDLRRSAASALGEMDGVAVEDLLDALESPKPVVRAAAAHGLRFSKKSVGKTVAPVHRALDDKQPQVRASAAETLGILGQHADVIVPSLVGRLADDEAVVREAAMGALIRFGASAAEPLVEQLKTKQSDLAIEALSRIGPKAVKALTRGFQDSDPRVREGCARGLGRMGWQAYEGVKGLTDAVKDEDVTVRRASARALGRIGPSAWSAGPALATALKDKDALVRANAAEALGLIGTGAQSLVDALNESMKDPDLNVRVGAALAGWRLAGDPAAGLALLRGLVNDRSAAPAVRIAAAQALGTLRWDARAAIPELAATLPVDAEVVEPVHLRAASAHALGEIASTSGAGIIGRRERWEKERDKKVRGAIGLGLEWLAAHQDRKGDLFSGFWDADEFMKHDPKQDKCDGPGKALYDPGVTSLALLAFMGAGYSDADEHGPFAENVRAGLRYLISIQDEGGCLGPRNNQHFVYNHALSTLALCEAWMLTRNGRYRLAAQKGLDFIASARNPYLAWRYGMRPGDNDTSVTAWMVMALRAGDLGGLQVEFEGYDGAASWFSKMTDPDNGVAGYIVPGGSSARPEGLHDQFPAERSASMTAAARWGNYLCGKSASKWPSGPGLSPISSLPPVWDPSRGSIDMYYWHWGALAMFQARASEWKKWRAKLEQALLPVQHAAGSGSRAGSWDPIGPWGPEGGRVYSTAMALLMLQTPYRYTRGFMGRPKLTEPFAAALPALKKAARDKNASVKAAAQHALARIRRDR